MILKNTDEMDSCHDKQPYRHHGQRSALQNSCKDDLRIFDHQIQLSRAQLPFRKMFEANGRHYHHIVNRE
jgi:hypothetical protein